MEISVSPYGKRALSLGVLNDEGRVTCQLYILENGNIHPDSWIRHEGRRPEDGSFYTKEGYLITQEMQDELYGAYTDEDAGGVEKPPVRTGANRIFSARFAAEVANESI